MRRITKKEVNQLGTEYTRCVVRWGKNNLVTVRAMVAYEEAKTQYARQQQETKKCSACRGTGVIVAPNRMDCVRCHLCSKDVSS